MAYNGLATYVYCAFVAIRPIMYNFADGILVADSRDTMLDP